MAAAGEVLRRNMPGNVGPCGGSLKGSPELLHVLAVDDSIVDRKVIEKLLRSLSCKVTVVDSGSRALQFLGLDGGDSSVEFEALKVNLIMTDYSMPGMTGYELLKKIKGSSTFREIPVVIMSSERILARINSCLDEGAEEFLSKPVKLSDVERLTRILTRGEAEETEEVAEFGKRKLRTDDFESSSTSSPLSDNSSPSSSSESSSPSTKRLRSG